MRITFEAAQPNAALRASTKSVCLLVLHRETQDPRFLRAANERYSQALIRTKRQVECPKTNKETVLGTAHFLSLCEILNSSCLESTAARPHTFWFLTLLQSCLDHKNAQILLGSPMRIFAVRERLVAQELPPGIRAVNVSDTNADRGSLDVLCNIAVGAVALIVGDGRKPEFVVEILEHLQAVVKLEGMLRRWITGYYTYNPDSQYWIVDSPFIGAPRRVFSQCYSFPALLVAKVHITYWMCLAVLVSSRLRIITAHCCDLDLGHQQLITAKLALAEALSHICISIPYMSTRECGWSGRILPVRPIHFLIIQLKEQHEWQKLAWCLQRAAELKTLSPRTGTG